LSDAFTVLASQTPLGPLSISSTSPANGATNVSLAPTIEIAFNEPLDPATVGPASFTLANGSSALPATVAYNSTANLVTLTLAGVLRPQTTYTVTVMAQVRNLAQSPLNAAYKFSFTTVPPASVSGSITTTSGLDPTTLTIVSFAGNTTTPTSNGSFAATLNPQGTGLVAAMLPGKSFGLLAMTIGGTPANSNVDADFQGQVAVGPRVHATQWQVTASDTAATSANSLVVDFQTTAEALVFMSPYLLTADGRRAPTIQSAIAANPATAQLAEVLAQTWSEADPLSDITVQAARQNAVQAVIQALVSQSAASKNSAQSERGGLWSSAALSYWSPPTAAATPYCWDFPGHTASMSGLQCLDLDYISLEAGAITVDQHWELCVGPYELHKPLIRNRLRYGLVGQGHADPRIFGRQQPGHNRCGGSGCIRTRESDWGLRLSALRSG
jgi:methionine-rich copper-binding protein CopC